MFLPRKRTGASFVIMVIIMALVMSTFAISVSQQSRSRSSTLISDATEKQVLYLAEDAANQMIYKLNTGYYSDIASTPATDVGPNFKYDASYLSGTKPYNKGVGTVRGTGYLMNSAYPNDTSKAIYSKTVYLEVDSKVAAPLMVYTRKTEMCPGSNTSYNVPYYRVWNGTAWGDENPVPGVIYSRKLHSDSLDIPFVTLVFAPGGGHAMLGLEDSSGNVYAQEWTGTGFASDPIPIGTTGATTTRSFDIAYENTLTNGTYRAICVFGYNATTKAPYYSIWNGSLWSSPKSLEGSVPSAMTQPNFIELASNPTTGSKEIGMIYQDSGGRVFGEVWNGTIWDNMGQPTPLSPWGTVNNASCRAVGLAYEQTSGQLMFAYATQQGIWGGGGGYSRVWNGSSKSLSGESPFTSNFTITTIAWLSLSPVPGTNQIIAAYEKSNNPQQYTLYTSLWDGSSWTDKQRQQGTLYKDYTCLYFAFSSNGANNGTLVFSSGDKTLVRMTWSGGTTWTTSQTINSWTQSYAVVTSSPAFPNILAGFYQKITSSPGNTTSEGNINEWHTDTSGTWQTMTAVKYAAGTSNEPERLAIAIPPPRFTAVEGTWRENY